MSGVVKGIGSIAGKILPAAATLFGGPAGPLIGAGLGALGGVLGRGKEDPRYAANTGYLNQLQALPPPQTAGVDPMSEQAFGLLQHLATSGPDISQFQNPYESQVVGGMQRDITGARTAALNTADDVATREGAFGGSRSGLMGATAIGEVNKTGLNNLATFRYQGYSDAVKNAMAQQEFGLQSAGALANAGDYKRSVLQAGYDAPFNRLQAMGPLTAQQLAAGSGYQGRPSVLQSALGGALTGFGLFKQKPGAAAGPTASAANGSSVITKGWLDNWLSAPPRMAH